MAFSRVNATDCTSYPLNDKQWVDLGSLKEGEKSVVGIKTELPEDVCPNNYTDVNFISVSPQGKAYPWKLRANGIWSFRICYRGWTQFKRSDGSSVCMKLVNQTGISKYNIGQKCWHHEIPQESLVAGVHSAEEGVWMQEEIAKYTTSGGEPMNYWTSGVRDGTCENTDSHEKKINFKWNDELTTGSAALNTANSELSCKDEGVAKNCLVVMSQESSSPQIFRDFDCESTVSIGGGFCIYNMWWEIK